MSQSLIASFSKFCSRLSGDKHHSGSTFLTCSRRSKMVIRLSLSRSSALNWCSKCPSSYPSTRFSASSSASDECDEDDAEVAPSGCCCGSWDRSYSSCARFSCCCCKYSATITFASAMSSIVTQDFSYSESLSSASSCAVSRRLMRLMWALRFLCLFFAPVGSSLRSFPTDVLRLIPRL
jgi:hypothetical protein